MLVAPGFVVRKRNDGLRIIVIVSFALFLGLFSIIIIIIALWLLYYIIIVL